MNFEQQHCACIECRVEMAYLQLERRLRRETFVDRAVSHAGDRVETPAPEMPFEISFAIDERSDTCFDLMPRSCLPFYADSIAENVPYGSQAKAAAVPAGTLRVDAKAELTGVFPAAAALRLRSPSFLARGSPLSDRVARLDAAHAISRTH